MSRKVRTLRAEGDVDGLIEIAVSERLGYRERREAIDALGEMKASTAVDALIPLLSRERLVVQTANALGAIGDARAAPYLAHLMKSRNRTLRLYSELNMNRLYAADPYGVRDALDNASGR